MDVQAIVVPTLVTRLSHPNTHRSVLCGNSNLVGLNTEIDFRNFMHAQRIPQKDATNQQVNADTAAHAGACFWMYKLARQCSLSERPHCL